MKKRPDIILSLILSIILLALTALFAVLLPVLLDWYIRFRSIRQALYIPMLVTAYGCTAAAVTALIFLIRLLVRIREGFLFDADNIRSLTALSLCFLGATLCAACGGFFYFPFWAAALAGLFMFLLLRIIRMAFARAAEIKSENDMTI